SLEAFYTDGCDNCEELLNFKGDRKTINSCTSSNFKGFIALTKPETSWVAKWQRLDHLNVGIYAISVFGTLPDEIKDTLKEYNVEYINRDTSVKN
ncbi:MAG: Transcription elongation factor SPT4, partial [Paramarteilia canceri]